MNQLTRIPVSLACDFNRVYEMFRTSSIIEGSARPSSSRLKCVEYECEEEIDIGENNCKTNFVHTPICKSKILSHSMFNSPKSTAVESITDPVLQLKPLHISSLYTTSTSIIAEMVDATERRINSGINSCIKVDKEMEILPYAADASVQGFERVTQMENSVEGNEEEPASYPVSNRNINCTETNPAKADESPRDTPLENATKECTAAILHMETAKTDMPPQNHAILVHTQSAGQKQLGKSSPNSKPFQRDVLDHREQRSSKALKIHNAASLLLDKAQLRRDAKSIPMKLKHTQNYDLGVSIIERNGNPNENGENFVCNSTKVSS